MNVLVPEWLSGMTRNHVGFARAGSNPAVHVYTITKILLTLFLEQYDFKPMTTKSRGSNFSLSNHLNGNLVKKLNYICQETYVNNVKT